MTEALEPCRVCGQAVATEAPRCPGCGARTSHGRKVRGRAYLALALVVGLAIGVPIAWKIKQNQNTSMSTSTSTKSFSECIADPAKDPSQC